MNRIFTTIHTYRLPIAVGVASFAIVACIIFVATLNAATNTNLEAESGTQTNVSQVSDTSASGSTAIRFGPVNTDPPTCDYNATTANFSTQLSAAATGKVICLASGSYGTFTGTAKAVTITKQSGATPSMYLEFRSGDKDFTIDGLTITGGDVVGNSGNYSDTNNPKNITIKNSTFTGALQFEYIANSNILLASNTHNNIDTNSTCTASPARIHFSYSGNTTSGVTIQDSLFEGGNTDGIQAGTGFTALRNEFRNIDEKSADDCSHTDAVQLLSANGAILRGNYIHHSADGIVAYDGVSNVTLEYNVIDLVGGRNGIELYSDTNSIIRYNTLVKRSTCEYSGMCGLVDLNHKTVDPAGSGTVVENNIVMAGINLNNGSTASVNRNNMFVSGASGSNFNGTPVFTGGANPTTWAGYFLTAGSPGLTNATDGGRVGIRNF